MPMKTETGVGGWGGEVKRERGVVDKEKKEERWESINYYLI